MSAYCANSPVIHVDPDGTEYRLVGGGFQFEVDWGSAVIGVEVIVYWDVDECDDGGYQVAVYGYEGIALPADDPLLASILTTITDNSDFLIEGSEVEIIAVASLLSAEYSIAVSGVAILGDETFNSTKAYEGSFSSSGISGGKLRGSFALAKNCVAFSLGGNLVGSSAIPSLSVSKTIYQQWFEFNTADILPRKKNVSYGGGR